MWRLSASDSINDLAGTVWLMNSIHPSMDDSVVYCISRFFRYVLPATLASIVIVFVRVNMAGFANDDDNAWVGT